MIGNRSGAAGVLAPLWAVVAGCGGDTTAPPQLAPSYELVSYEGQSLPVVTRRLIGITATPGGGGGGYSCDDKLTRSLLEFAADNRYKQTDSRLLVCDDGRPDESSSSTVTGDYLRTSYGVELDTDAVASPLGAITERSLASINGNELTVYMRTVYHSGAAATYTGAPLIFRANP